MRTPDSLHAISGTDHVLWLQVCEYGDTAETPHCTDASHCSILPGAGRHNVEGRLRLPLEQALVLAVEDSPGFVAGGVVTLASLSLGKDKLVAAMRSNGALAWGEHHPLPQSPAVSVGTGCRSSTWPSVMRNAGNSPSSLTMWH